ncbi:hypothetical protein B0T17DRAFT_512738 [Bombardia bombarda]|uniref:tRNA (uracil-O(2)-)-methyltransferase n=1 Tax=Bombardia bombarda TaxID=252184 RepID=A0AA39TJF4_9PEZI|nr:hypothetical protein B0T17DRAFT_512738 [Bombardia bombarda]
MVFRPDELAADAAPIIAQDPTIGTEAGTEAGTDAGHAPLWRPLFRHQGTFPPESFVEGMLDLIKNPNNNSSWLFRADILHDAPVLDGAELRPVQFESGEDNVPPSSIPSFSDFQCSRYIVRRMIPRNTLRDKPLDQTCLVAHAILPPGGPGVAFLHEWTDAESRGSVSLSYDYFDESDRSVNRITRTGFHLLEVIHKHGQGKVEGYRKRVHHDVLIPQARVQNRYTTLKQKYARPLIQGWAEITDPVKHVFEDISIAAFLIELWVDMYGQQQTPFPGFVDIGCGNGLLVYILNQEGCTGWGFDARARKSWSAYSTRVELSTGVQDSLQRLVLLPPPVSKQGMAEVSGGEDFNAELVHDGCFPKGTFIISNHADELTPWTPILATISDCPFIMIPCCSHDLTGARFRAPPPKDKTKPDSSYASLVLWVAEIAKDCGWEPEQEMLRIPSTRNTALVGRKRRSDGLRHLDTEQVVEKYGGTYGYLETVVKLAKNGAQGGLQQMASNPAVDEHGRPTDE